MTSKFGIAGWLLSRRVQRYVIIGLLVYVFELVVIVSAQAIGLSDVVAVGVSFWFGLLLSFTLQKIITFGDKRLQHHIVLAQFLAVCLLVLFNFCFTLLVTSLLGDYLPAVICRTIALAITTLWNFYIYKKWIFKVTEKKRAKTKKTTISSKKSHYVKLIKRRYKKLLKTSLMKRLRRRAKQPKFAKAYLVSCLIILFGTTTLWTILGARLQESNADQLVNAYLFSDTATFHGAAMPDQHSFLFKWPLFLIVKLFGFSPASFIGVTLLAVLLTVACLVYILSRIERRPIVLGTLCLALASILLLVPTQPYAGGLLPVSMAMMTTRNLEYVLYVAALYLIAKATSLRSKSAIAAVLALGILIASDKLFLSVSLAGALLATTAYLLLKQRDLVRLSARWLVLGLIAGSTALLLIAAINGANITNIVSQSLTGPYGVVDNVKSVSLASVYAALGVLTNLGANPVYDALTIKSVPNSLGNNLFSIAGPAYIINGLFVLTGLLLSLRLLLASLGLIKRPKYVISTSANLAIMMLWASIAIVGLFIMTNHYYVVDARYLSISLFTLFIVVAVHSASKKLKPEVVLLSVPLLLFGIVCGTIASFSTHQTQQAALMPLDQRNEVIIKTIASHRVDVLVGDYWRVLPTLVKGNNKQIVSPLSDCTTTRQVLTSSQWQPDLRKHSFAYLLTLEGSMTDYPDCTLSQIEESYGLPNSSALIDGTLAHPKELLLFYDSGITKTKNTKAGSLKSSATILPVSLASIKRNDCQGNTVMNIVAHQDDDLLFMSPDLLHDVTAGNCVRTVYLTAGDAGAEEPYWLAREKGSEAAYSLMLGSKSLWVQRIVRLPNGQFVTIDSPRGNDRASLIFMHLPDGNLRGEGFGAFNNESLDSLVAGRMESLDTVDRQSSYNSKQLVDALVALMEVYQPAEIRSQSSLSGSVYPDHSDHLATSQLVKRAYAEYSLQQPVSRLPSLSFYLGYTGREYDSNLSEQDYADKLKVFMAYARFDGSVCRSTIECRHTETYGSYLSRQHTSPD